MNTHKEKCQALIQDTIVSLRNQLDNSKEVTKCMKRTLNDIDVLFQVLILFDEKGIEL